jgi:hypothetical protein
LYLKSGNRAFTFVIKEAILKGMAKDKNFTRSSKKLLIVRAE